LTLVGGETPEPAYVMQPEGCTGCGLCTAVCEAGAIQVETLQPEPDHLSLRRQVCRGCRAEFLRPAVQPQGDGLCPICARAPHYRKLHQVLP
jgi:ferredoxin